MAVVVVVIMVVIVVAVRAMDMGLLGHLGVSELDRGNYLIAGGGSGGPGEKKCPACVSEWADGRFALDLISFLYANDAARFRMIFIETRVFTEDLPKYLSDDQYRDFQQFLACNPEAGDRVPGTGGLRKIRWCVEARGKSGGVRVIYYYLTALSQLRMILIYRKGMKDDLAADEKR